MVFLGLVSAIPVNGVHIMWVSRICDSIRYRFIEYSAICRLDCTHNRYRLKVVPNDLKKKTTTTTTTIIMIILN